MGFATDAIHAGQDPDPAAVRSHTGQDRGPILPSEVGEPPTRSDFSEEEQGTEKCRRHRSEKR